MSTLPEIPYNYLVIEGNIGSGKTTFSEMIGRDYPSTLILEQFADNPFLPYFYEDPHRYGFPVELFFMTERYKQLQALGTQGDLFHSLMVSDYGFVKTLLFARINLPPDEFRIFQKLWMVLESSLPRPELIVFLHRPVPELLDLIEKRGRDYEKQIKADYLQRVQDIYFEYFRGESQIPILLFDIQGKDFLEDKAYYDELLRVIAQTHRPGMQHIRIH